MKKSKILFNLVSTAASAVLFFGVFGVSLAKPDQLPPQASPVAAAHAAVCPGPAAPGSARCHARVVVDKSGGPQTTGTPAGYGPMQFRTAYGLLSASSTATIGIVDAYNDPNIENDLATYSTKYSLPQCTTANGCFQKINQRGSSASFPSTNAGWALEIALDVEVAHGVCPTCKILLVEADSNSFANLLAAEAMAAQKGANVISNSWGANEFSGETGYDGQFAAIANSGKAITFSSGDSGYGVEYPAASQYVTAVGGTTLNLDAGYNRLSETAWSGSGSGCSAFEPTTSFQTLLNLPPGCGHRIVADVSADANPNTGAAVYDSVKLQGRSGWFVVGGTSLASPIIAAVYALNGNTAGGNSLPYTQGITQGIGANLFDVTSGSNGSCGGSYLCTAVSGYDGPTGLGTPKGTGAF